MKEEEKASRCDEEFVVLQKGAKSEGCWWGKRDWRQEGGGGGGLWTITKVAAERAERRQKKVQPSPR